MVIVNTEKIEYALTNTDLNKFLPDVKIYTYEELADTQNLKELLPDRRCAIIILAEQMPNIGHWVCIVKVERSYIFFDSYGQRPDKTINWTDKQLRKCLNQDYPHISFLLNTCLNDGFKVVYSGFAYQNKNNFKIATCGRWVIVFITYMLKTPKATLNSFYDMIKKNCNAYQLNPDHLVTFLTDDV